jgi:hypothetical protein
VQGTKRKLRIDRPVLTPAYTSVALDVAEHFNGYRSLSTRIRIFHKVNFTLGHAEYIT